MSCVLWFGIRDSSAECCILFFRSCIPFLYKIAICLRSIPVDFSSSVNACKVVSHRILDIKKKGIERGEKKMFSMKASCVLSINNVCWSYVISSVSSLRRIELMRDRKSVV